MEGLAVVAAFVAIAALAIDWWLYKRWQEVKAEIEEINGLLWEAHIREEQEAESVEDDALDWLWPHRRQD